MKHSKLTNKIITTKDQSAIIRYSLDNSLEWEQRALAVDKLQDTTILLEIIDNEEMAPVRQAAKERLLKITQDENLKAYFAINDESWEIRIEACKVITDEDTLYTILEGEADEYVRKAAKDRLIELGVDLEYFQ